MNRKIKIVFVILSIVLSSALVAFMFFNMGFGDGVALNVFLVLIGMYLTTYVHVVFHELGHLLGGKAGGFKLISFRVAFLKFVRVNDKVKLRFSFLKDYGGICQMIPTRFENMKDNFKRMIKGGLIHSGIFAILSLLFVLSPLLFGNFGRVYFFIAPCFPIAIYTFLINAIPSRSSGAPTDGDYLYYLRHNTLEGVISLKMLFLQTYLMGGYSPKEIDKDLFFDFPEIDSGDPNVVMIESYRYGFYLDTKDYENAIKSSDKIKNLLHLLPEIYHDMLLGDIFYTELVLKKNLETSREIYKKIKDNVERESDISSLRIKMAKELYLDKNFPKAMATARFALSLKDKYIMKGIAKMEEEIIDQMKWDAKALEKEEMKLVTSMTPYFTLEESVEKEKEKEEK